MADSKKQTEQLTDKDLDQVQGGAGAQFSNIALERGYTAADDLWEFNSKGDPDRPVITGQVPNPKK